MPNWFSRLWKRLFGKKKKSRAARKAELSRLSSALNQSGHIELAKSNAEKGRLKYQKERKQYLFELIPRIHGSTVAGGPTLISERALPVAPPEAKDSFNGRATQAPNLRPLSKPHFCFSGGAGRATRRPRLSRSSAPGRSAPSEASR